MNTPTRDTRPWAIGAAVVVVAAIVVGLVTSGGGGDTATSSAGLPAGGQATVVNDAPPPKKGDKVVAASETSVHGIHYRVVASVADTADPKRYVVPLYFNEYLGEPLTLAYRFKVPNALFYRDSAVASFSVQAKPDPNPDKAAAVAFSWFPHIGDQDHETKHYGVSQHGIRVD